MTDEERALSIIAEMQDEDGALGFTLSACETAEMADLIAAALREARVEGARRALELAADHTEDLFDLCGPFPARKTLSDLADSIRALDPEEVVNTNQKETP